jgi:hypothetical protein
MGHRPLAVAIGWSSLTDNEGGMSKKRVSPSASKAVSLERAARLYRLIKFLGTGPKTRAAVLQKLHIDIRTFYRDLELLREYKIDVELKRSRYILEDKVADALERLPLPDPGLTLGEARILSKGKTPIHLKLRRLLSQITR